MPGLLFVFHLMGLMYSPAKAQRMLGRYFLFRVQRLQKRVFNKNPCHLFHNGLAIVTAYDLHPP